MKYVSTKELKALGWTTGMIKLLGHPATTLTVGIRNLGDGYKARVFTNAWCQRQVDTVKESDAWKKLAARKAKREAS
jgi:hypothetical protein